MQHISFRILPYSCTAINIIKFTMPWPLRKQPSYLTTQPLKWRVSKIVLLNKKIVTNWRKGLHKPTPKHLQAWHFEYRTKVQPTWLLNGKNKVNLIKLNQLLCNVMFSEMLWNLSFLQNYIYWSVSLFWTAHSVGLDLIKVCLPSLEKLETTKLSWY